MNTTQHSGIVVSTPIRARGLKWNHAEGIVVSTGFACEPGGGGGIWLNHAEGIVVSTGFACEPGGGGGIWLNHAEGIVAA